MVEGHLGVMMGWGCECRRLLRVWRVGERGMEM